MIRLEMTAKDGELKMRFDVPDQPGEEVRLDELATFALHLDVVKQRLTALTSRAIAKNQGYDLVIE